MEQADTIEPSPPRALGARLAVGSISLIAIAIGFVACFGIFLALFKAHSFDRQFLLQFAHPAAIAAASALLFEGARLWRRWALWPALALFALIAPLAGTTLYQTLQGPRVPAGGFATQEELADPDRSLLSQAVRPSESDHFANWRKAQLMLLTLIVLSAFPCAVIYRLRQTGSLS